MNDEQEPSEKATPRKRRTHQVTAPTQGDFDDLVKAAKRQYQRPNSLAGSLWAWALPMFRTAGFNKDRLDELFGDAIRRATPTEESTRKKGNLGR